MKLVIIWSNGDKEKISLSEEYATSLKKTGIAHQGFKGWGIRLTDGLSALNMEHARSVHYEE